MLKHTIIATLLTLGLAAPAFAQTTQTPPPTTGQKTAHVAPRAKRTARLAAVGDQGRAKLRADLKATRTKLKALKKSGVSTSTRERHQLKRQVRNLRQRIGRLRHRGK
jgi:septal ring factor EnvC (AmiA/AmiB activator)